MYTRLDDVDWANWKAQQLATLLFVVRDGQVLLIHKKRGLGAGKINGPGGRLNNGESAMQAAIREVQEELRVTPLGLEYSGELSFQFVDGLSIHVEVFRASDCDGEPQETDEAKPLWAPLDKIPFERMWADDRLWIPLMLARKKFSGRFLFDADTMLGHEIDII
ncbi:MAG: 8-oxo-dGTP diphosphatase [candidate division KSB1 bacterium]|nr:8-oxo-dGTP diphosphatase [candidate division KSB1 bacterium]MDZ7367102.1 8-oxo-dGTP diphosphatase [candidate division KSB1 bacterium]MDZ7405080.1 8-oxo-dGTP diphosphatase [candidate division KSB1 bacterium]